MKPTDSPITPHTLTPAAYDVFSQVVFNKILSIVPKEPIANKLLENVFVDMYVNKNLPPAPVKSPLLSLLHHAHLKSNNTVKALAIFRECCGASAADMHSNQDAAGK